MRNQKMLIIILIITTVLSLIAYLVGYYNCSIAEKSSILESLALAIFGSAIVGLFMSLSSYNTIKQQEISDAMRIVDKFVHLLSTIQPLQVLIPQELLSAYFSSKNSKVPDALYDTLQQNGFIKPDTERNLTVERLYLEWVKQTFDSPIEDEIITEAKKRIDDAKNCIQETIALYSSLPRINKDEIEDSFNKLCFFNKSKQKLVEELQTNIQNWDYCLSSIYSPPVFAKTEHTYYYMLNSIQRIEGILFSFSDWEPYEHELDNDMAIYTYKQRTIYYKHKKEISLLKYNLLDNKTYQIWTEEEYKHATKTDYAIAPII